MLLLKVIRDCFLKINELGQQNTIFIHFPSMFTFFLCCILYHGQLNIIIFILDYLPVLHHNMLQLTFPLQEELLDFFMAFMFYSFIFVIKEKYLFNKFILCISNLINIICFLISMTLIIDNDDN